MKTFVIKSGLFISLITLLGCTQPIESGCDSAKFELMDRFGELELNLEIAYDDFGYVNECAKALDKPILTIYGCYSCISFRIGVWRPLGDEEVNSILQKDFLIRYYHVDNKLPLPDSIQLRSSAKNIGHFFLSKQRNNYDRHYQPLYTITDWRENDVIEPVGYVDKSEMEKFREFVKKGKAAYYNR